MSAALFRGLLFLILMLAVIGRGNADDREQFSRAVSALESGDLATFEDLQASLRTYPLYPYLRFAALTRDLGAAPRADVHDFLEAFGSSPLGRRLRIRWLLYLARSGQWRDFINDFESDLGTDLDCYKLEAQFRSGQRDQALENVPKVWISPRSRPDACDQIFQLWINRGGPTPDQAWKRLQLAAGAGQLRLAKYLKRFIPSPERPTADLWIDAYRNPALVLDTGILDPQLVQATPIAVHAMRRLASMTPQIAAARLGDASKRYRIPVETLAALRYQIAIGLAVDGHPGAAFWLESVPEANRDASLRAWSVRTALRNRNWQSALEAIETMPAQEADTALWRYWRARALEALGETTTALEVYRSLAQERDYHGFLAADRIGLEPSLNNRPLQVDAAVKRQLLQHAPIQRARELYALKRVHEATSEWRFGLVDAAADEYRAAAKIAHDWGWYNQAIITVARARDWNDLEIRFPTRYREMVMSAARQDGIDPAWVFGILRQESLFDPTIRSRVGATGLMQIMPATGRLVAKELGMSWSGRPTLIQPAYNIRIGSRYLRMGLDRLKDRHIFATAGYNAGPGRVEQWLATGESAPADIWVELIPFRETRRYLRRVIEYTVIYQHRLGHQTDFVSRVMGPVIHEAKGGTTATLPRGINTHSFLVEPPGV